MTYRQRETQQTAAARAGISERSGRRIEKGQSQGRRSPRTWRTREDPLEAVWSTVLAPLLERESDLKPITLLEHLEATAPEVDWRQHRRTLERRVRRWRAEHGPEQAVIFPQDHPPGRMGLSDFTDATDLGVTVAGEPLPHRLYHFTLAHSRWQHAEVVLGGESYVALAEGLQNALWALGGSPAIHRTDSLSAAYRNLDAATIQDLTERYRALCGDYGMTPSRNNRGEGHENGAVESAHGHLKTAIKQALLLRGSHDFETLDAYRRFIAELVSQRNARRQSALEAELPHLRRLPAQRSDDFEEAVVTVTSSSAFTLRRVFYTVPSRLIGHRLKVRLYDDRLECFLGAQPVLTLRRGQPDGPSRRGHVIDYRHVIHSLKCKPMALANLSYRDALLPGSVWRQTWEALVAAVDQRTACRTMIGLLALAHERNCERALSVELAQLLDTRTLPDIDTLAARFAEKATPPPGVVVQLPTAASYNQLLPQCGAWA